MTLSDLLPGTLTHVYARWTALLGHQNRSELQPGVFLVEHGQQLSSYHGMVIYRPAGGETLISVPALVRMKVQEVICKARPEDLLESAFWRDRLGTLFAFTPGRAFQGAVDGATFHPLAAPEVRLIDQSDAEALLNLKKAVPEQEWLDSNLDDTERQHTVGYFKGGCLLAAACAYRLTEGIAGLGVVTHPASRGHGAGRAVVSGVVEQLLAEDTVPCYQTLWANIPSVRLARQLGFVEVATTLSIRFLVTNQAESG